MQTFAPASDFESCAKLLDKPRLNKQITETKQILSVLVGTSEGYKNHPAMAMWRGHDPALRAYGRAMLKEWRKRGGGGHLECDFNVPNTWKLPWWWGDPNLILTHQSRLNHKWLVDELRKTIPRGEWPLFRQLYCKHLPKSWNEFCSRDREILTGILRDLYMGPAEPYSQFLVNANLHYIWPTEPGKFKVKNGKQWVVWEPGDRFYSH